MACCCGKPGFCSCKSYPGEINVSITATPGIAGTGLAQMDGTYSLPFVRVQTNFAGRPQAVYYLELDNGRSILLIITCDNVIVDANTFEPVSATLRGYAEVNPNDAQGKVTGLSSTSQTVSIETCVASFTIPTGTSAYGTTVTTI